MMRNYAPFRAATLRRTGHPGTRNLPPLYTSPTIDPSKNGIHMYRPGTLLLACWFANIAHADEVRIAVATNFTAPTKAIAAQFEQGG